MSDILGNLYAFLIDSNSFLKPGTLIEPGVSWEVPDKKKNCIYFNIILFLDNT